MTKSAFAAKHFHDEEAAREWFEAARWPDGPVCPNCGSLKHYATKKIGRYRCGEKECRKDFTVMTKSVMERSHAPLTHWAVAFHMAASSKKGFSAHQLHRELGCEYNTAWFMHHRVMEAMRAVAALNRRSAAKAVPYRPTRPITASWRRPTSQSSAVAVHTIRAARVARKASVPSSL
jgi:transposase-like protein